MSRIVSDTEGTEEEGIHVYLNSEDGTLDIIEGVDDVLAQLDITEEQMKICEDAGISIV